MVKRLIGIVLSFAVTISSFAITALAKDSITVLPKDATVIRAASYTNSNPKLISNTGNGLTLYQNQWVEYPLYIEEEGEYFFNLYAYASNSLYTTVELQLDNALLCTFPVIPNDGEQLANPSRVVTLPAGEHTLKLTNKAGGNNTFSKLVVERAVLPEVKEGAYRKVVLPAAIQAEDFDCGVGGSHSNDGHNGGLRYRRFDGIDIYGSDTEGYYITLEKGEYTRYTFEVVNDGEYTFILDAPSRGNIQFNLEGEEEVYTSQLSSGSTEILEKTLKKGMYCLQLEAYENPVSVDRIRIQTSKNGDSKDEPLPPTGDESVVWKELYMSLDGSDANDASKDAPVKSLKRIKELLAVHTPNMRGDIVVNISEGMYKLDTTEEFSPKHSGKNGYRVIIRGSGDNHSTVFSGGVKVTGWKKDGNVLWSAPAPDVDEIRNLYINDFPAIRARSKYSYLCSEIYDDPKTSTLKDGVRVEAKNFPKNLTNVDRMELIWPLEWTAQRTVVQSVKNEGETMLFIMKQPNFTANTGTSAVVPGAGKLFYLENAPELLDEPGEFYFNKQEKKIYYYPYEDEDMESCVTYVGETEGLISVKGNNLDEKVENLSFENLAFKYGVWDYPSENGLLCVQAESCIETGNAARLNERYMIPAQFHVERAKNLKIENCLFTCLGSSAIALSDAVSESEIVGNIIRDNSGTGVQIGQPDHSDKRDGMEMCSSITVSNNLLWRNAGEYRNCTGITAYYVSDVKILHNDLYWTPYTGFSIGWGWGTKSPEGHGDIEIAYNRLSDTMSSLRDGGHIYTLGPLKGSTLHDNYLVAGHSEASIGGIYHDAGSGYIRSYHNVIDESPSWFMRSGWHYIHDIKVNNNYSTTKTIAGPGDLSSLDLEPAIEVRDNEWNDDAISIMMNAGLEDKYKHLVLDAQKPSYKECRLENALLKRYVVQKEEGWIEAEDFMEGGEGVGYHKITPLFGQNSYRPNDGVSLLSSNSFEGYAIDTNFPEEWLAYEVDIPKDGTYFIDVNAGQMYGDNVAQPGFKVYVDDKLVIENGLVKKTEGWTLFESTTLGKLDLTAGKHIIKLEFIGNGFYFDALAVHDGSMHKTEEVKLTADGNLPQFDDAKIVAPKKEVTAKSEFADIIGHWAESHINEMYDRNIVKGVSESSFMPERQVTQKEASLFILRALGVEHKEDNWERAARQCRLTDAKMGNNIITREAFASMLIRAYELLGKDTSEAELPYYDASQIDGTHLSDVKKAYSLGILEGDDTNSFRPKGGLTRAEALKAIAMLIQL